MADDVFYIRYETTLVWCRFALFEMGCPLGDGPGMTAVFAPTRALVITNKLIRRCRRACATPANMPVRCWAGVARSAKLEWPREEGLLWLVRNKFAISTPEAGPRNRGSITADAKKLTNQEDFMR
jgi:hypothetical protein